MPTESELLPALFAAGKIVTNDFVVSGSPDTVAATTVTIEVTGITLAVWQNPLMHFDAGLERWDGSTWVKSGVWIRVDGQPLDLDVPPIIITIPLGGFYRLVNDVKEFSFPGRQIRAALVTPAPLFFGLRLSTSLP